MLCFGNCLRAAESEQQGLKGFLIVQKNNSMSFDKVVLDVPGIKGKPVESKTRTYHGWVGSGRPAGRPGRVGQDWVPTDRPGKTSPLYPPRDRRNVA